jgi:alpha-1,2-mannosyltransferase
MSLLVSAGRFTMLRCWAISDRTILDRVAFVVLVVALAWKFDVWEISRKTLSTFNHEHLRYPALDFFQDWAAARDHLAGHSIYEPLGESVRRHARALGLHEVDEPPHTLKLNAHPPSMILLVLPLARLDFVAAYRLWTWAGAISLPLSLYLVFRNVSPPFGARAAVAVSLGLALAMTSAYPVFLQFNHANVQMVLLFLLASAFAAERRRWNGLSGALVGVSTAMKLFPGFLGIYFLVTKRYRSAAATALTFAALQVAAAAVFGMEAFTEFVKRALPEVRQYRGTFPAVSVHGLWWKLFDKGSYASEFIELCHWPALARWGAAGSTLIVLAVYLTSAWKARAHDDDGRLFGLSVTTMLLVAPSSWIHSQILLVIPVAVLAWALPGPGLAAWMFRAAVILIWLPTRFILQYKLGPLVSGDGLCRPVETVTYLSINLYAMVALFALGCLSLRPPAVTPRACSGSPGYPWNVEDA